MAMGRLFAARRGRELAEFEADLIVPIPLFWMRRLRVQTNSAEIVAECLGRYLGVAVRRRLLVRSRNTLPQKGLKPRARFRNVRSAFTVRSGCRLEGSRVLLVDDTLTTGATCSEASRTLKQAGAATVAVAVIARAHGTDPT
jgi:ComF family protein